MQAVPVPKHGRLLWDAIEKERPALVVCNIFMAYCDAIHIMEQLNQNMETVPVFVALCASDNECLFERFLSAGGADIFVKPFDADILAERIVQHLEQADRKNNLRRVDFSPFSPHPLTMQQAFKNNRRAGHLTGYHYIKMGLTLLLENPARFSYGTKGLYQAIAQQTHSSYHRVERNIRTAVEAAFDGGIWRCLKNFSGLRSAGKLESPIMPSLSPLCMNISHRRKKLPTGKPNLRL